MKTGFTCGVFDLFHAGHVLMLKECKRHCDYLIVGLNVAKEFSTQINQNKNTPVYSFEDRKLIIESCRYVDEVKSYSNEDELIILLRTLKIDIRFLGEDYQNKIITGEDLSIPIHYIDRSHGKSTSNFRNQIYKVGEQLKRK